MNARKKTRQILYIVYQGMKQRCYNKENASYQNYGGRGIEICCEWLGEEGFSAFYGWAIENGYKQGLTIERLDNERGYEPDNCAWVTMQEQSHNRRTNTNATIDGETLDLKQWSDKTGIPYPVVLRRYHQGHRGIELILPVVTETARLGDINTRKIEVYMQPEAVNGLHEKAKEYGMNMSQLVREMVSYYLST